MLHDNSLCRRACLILLAGFILISQDSHGQQWTAQGSPWCADVRDLATGFGAGPWHINYLANESGVYRRLHDGSAWTATAAVSAIPIAVTCKPDDPAVVLVAMEKYLKRSANGGTTWTDIIVNDNAFHPLRLATSPTSSFRMYLGRTKVGGLSSMKRSENSGLTWNDVSYFFGDVQTNVAVIAPHPTDALRVWAGGTASARLEPWANFTTTRSNGVFFSNDGGATWDTCGSLRKDIAALAAYVRGGVTTVLAATTDPSLRRTTDNGGTWSTVSFPGVLIKDIVVKPFDSNVGLVYVAAEDGFYKSTNYGSSWTAVTTGLYGRPSRVDVMELGTLYLGTSANLFETVTAGDTWFESSDGISVLGFSGVGKQGGVMLGVSRFSAIHRNPGSGWTTAATFGILSPFMGTSVGFKAATGNTAFSTGTRTVGTTTRASFLRSTNAGNTSWAEVDTGTGAGRYNGFLIDPINNDRIYVYGKRTSTQNIRVSISSGSSWEDFSFTDGGVAPEVVSMVADPTGGGSQANTLYAAVYAGTSTQRGIWKRTIGGSWSRIAAAGDSVAALALSASTPMSLYAAGKTGSTPWLRRSTNGGTTWTTLTGITGPFTRLVINPANPVSGRDFFVVAANGSKVYRTRNAGITWEDLTFALPVPIYDLRPDVTSSYSLIAATAGGVYTFPLAAVTTINTQSPVQTNWNMTSIPAVIPSFLAADAYPGPRTSSVFKYTPGGYVAIDPVHYGQGHWVKYGKDTILARQGDKLQEMWVPVISSWNIVGTISDPVSVSSITEYWPPTIVRQSDFFKYSGGYVVVDTLLPGRGYWVKFSAAGLMRLQGGQQSQGGSLAQLGTFDRFTVTDAEGRSQDLYVRNSDLPSSLGEMEMPPPPPDAGFDARFASGNFLRAVDPDNGAVQLDIAVDTAAYPVTLSWCVRPENGITYTLGGGLGKASQGIRSSGTMVLTSAMQKLIPLRGVAEHIAADPGIPAAFMLHQNYPNPFNPDTRIQYDLPVDARVDLAVFDLLGRRVATLVNDAREAGRHTAVFTGSGLASGVYFVRLRATTLDGGSTFHDMRKIVLMK